MVSRPALGLLMPLPGGPPSLGCGPPGGGPGRKRPRPTPGKHPHVARLVVAAYRILAGVSTPSSQQQALIQQVYQAFNDRDIPAVLATFHPQVRWPRAWEGDYVTGHDAVRAYWTKQWQEVNPRVEPTALVERPDGRLEVAVHQLVKDAQGQVLFDGPVQHLYTIEDGVITQMDIEQP